MTPAMTPREIEFYDGLLASARRIVEYGVGGSTEMAVKRENVELIRSIESDAAWLKMVLSVPAIMTAERALRCVIVHVDIGTTKEWGYPVDGSRRDAWPQYAARPWDPSLPRPDLVLVDGRFRVACVMQSVLNGSPETTIAIHDFWDRPYYHAVLPFLDWIASTERFGAFHPRASFDRDMARNLLTRHLYDVY